LFIIFAKYTFVLRIFEFKLYAIYTNYIEAFVKEFSAHKYFKIISEDV